MNTKKALATTIILLMIMNIALGVYVAAISSGKGTGDIITYTENILAQRNIVLECSIPDINFKASPISVGESIFTPQSVESIKTATGGDAYFDEQTGVLTYIRSNVGNANSGEINRTAADIAAAEFMESIGLGKEDFILDFAMETSRDTYVLKYILYDGTGIYYYDNFIETTVTGRDVVTAKINYYKTGNIVRQEEDVMPVSAILLSNLVREQNKTLSIISITRGFKKKAIDSNEATMCWRVRFGDGSERFFEASSGLEIK
ncbi:MAG: two-component system regulatory protein YycI [Clostridia bacterium]